MKSWRLFAILLLFAASAIAKDSAVQIKVSGMTGGACAVSVKRDLEKTKGVKSADVSVEKGLATVVYGPTDSVGKSRLKGSRENFG